jgi:hypothetical protein
MLKQEYDWAELIRACERAGRNRGLDDDQCADAASFAWYTLTHWPSTHSLPFAVWQAVRAVQRGERLPNNRLAPSSRTLRKKRTVSASLLADRQPLPPVEAMRRERLQRFEASLTRQELAVWQDVQSGVPFGVAVERFLCRQRGVPIFRRSLERKWFAVE